MNANLIGL